MAGSIKGEARERILEVAAELIARHGVSGVSVRSINAAAGVSAGILHYHFGNMDSLVNALLERHMVPLLEERVRLCEALAQKSRITVRDIVEILVLPLARKIAADPQEGFRYVRFLTRLHSDHNRETEVLFERYFGGRVASLPNLLMRARPQIPLEVFRVRLLSSSPAMLFTLAELEGLQKPDGTLPLQHFWQRVELLVEYLCGGLGAPTRFKQLAE